MTSIGRVSIVIPTRNSARTIAECVASSVRCGPDVEVIVVDNASVDGTADLARRAGAHVVVSGGPERSAQRNQGARLAQGDVVVFIDSDMVVDTGFAAAVRRCFATPDVAAAVVPETAFGTGYLAACRALEKRLALGDGSVEAARAYRREVLARHGGFDERLHGFEDYELSDRVAAATGGLGRCSKGVRHDEGRVALRTLFAKKRYYGTQWAQGARAVGPHRWRRRVDVSLLARDPVHVPGLAVLKVVDLAGLLTGHLVDARSLPAR